MENAKILLYLLSKLLLLVFVITLIVVSIPETSISFNNYKTQIRLRRLMPEGWAFFTRDPQEPDFEYFIIKNSILLDNRNFPHTTTSNYFGLKRIPKLLNSELFMILNELDSSAFKSTEGTTIKELSEVERTFIRVKNPSKSKKLLDSICVVLYKPIPWAWSKTLSPHTNSGKCAFLIIE